jgi:putative endonuclease
MAAWLYIMTNRPDGTLYIGATTDVAARAWQRGESELGRPLR